MNVPFVLLTGPIGAGKTSIAPLVLSWFPEDLEYISPDFELWCEFGNRLEGVGEKYQEAKEAARRRLDDALARRMPVLWETVVASTWKFEVVRLAGELGYAVLTVFVRGGGTSACAQRSLARAMQGWFEVDARKQENRYWVSGASRSQLRVLSDRWIEIETRGSSFELVEDSESRYEKERV